MNMGIFRRQRDHLVRPRIFNMPADDDQLGKLQRHLQRERPGVNLLRLGPRGWRFGVKGLDCVRQVLDIALHYQLTVNMFYHPVYIARSPACREAIDELLRLIEERGVNAAHMGNDALYDWWEARSRSFVAEWEAKESGGRFMTRCAAPSGMVVQIPLGSAAEAMAQVDGTQIGQGCRAGQGLRTGGTDFVVVQVQAAQAAEVER